MNKTVNQIISKFTLTQDKYDLLIKKLSRYNKNNYIYKSAFKRAGYSIKFIDQFFDQLEKEQFLEKNYVIYSPFTHERQNFVTNDLKEIPDYYECETTDEEFDTNNQVRIIYKIKKEFL